MNIGILGSGGVARTLAEGFLKHGHAVQLGTRDASQLADFAKTHPTVEIGQFSDAAAFAEVVVLAVKGTAALDALRLAGSAHLAGKTVIDATNPIADAPPVAGVLTYFTGPNDSLMERLQKEHSDARFVKAFNSVGAPVMVNPQFTGGPPSMFICGNDDGAKAQVKTILTQFGWETVDMGQVQAARAIEPLCALWCIPGIASGDWSPRAFKLLK